MRMDIGLNADPYSWAMERIVGSILKVNEFGRMGKMSDDEAHILEEIRRVIEARDPLLSFNVPAPKAIVVRR